MTNEIGSQQGMQKSTFRAFGFSLMGLIILALIAGCSTPPKPDPVMPPVAMNTAVGDKGFLNIKITSSGGNADSERIAKVVADVLSSQLSAQGFTLASGENPDVTVAVIAQAREFDRSGNYLVYDGSIGLESRRVCDGKLLGATNVTARSERKLDAGPALDSLGAKLAAGLGNWSARSITMQSAGLAASALHVTCIGKQEQDAAYAKMFVDRVSALPGMVKCTVLSHDYTARNMTFRMVYFMDKFPDGVYTRLLAMPELYLKPLPKK